MGDFIEVSELCVFRTVTRISFFFFSFWLIALQNRIYGHSVKIHHVGDACWTQNTTIIAICNCSLSFLEFIQRIKYPRKRDFGSFCLHYFTASKLMLSLTWYTAARHFNLTLPRLANMTEVLPYCSKCNHWVMPIEKKMAAPSRDRKGHQTIMINVHLISRFNLSNS